MTKHICTRWAFDLSTWTPTLPQLAQAVAAVQPEERTRLGKFHFIDDFLSSLFGRLLMRKYVSSCSGLAYHEVQFARDVRGKPYWTQQNDVATPELPALSFNVSHQGGMVLFAGVAAPPPSSSNENKVDFGVGADVMKIEYAGGKSLSEFFRIMQNKFSEHEWSYIRRPQHNEKAQIKAFMRHWCLKEAYVKELGVGITVDLEKISFTVDTRHPLEANSSPLTCSSLRVDDVPMTDWHFEEHLLNDKFCAAIAFRNCKPQMGKFEMLKFNDLLLEQSTKSDEDHIITYCNEALQKQRKN